jgi:DNA-binding CsgD family transcriptional regulator
MSQLTSIDLTRLLTAVTALSSSIDPNTLADRTLTAVLSLVSNEMTAFDGFDSEGDYTGYYWYSPEGTVPQERVELLGELVHEHPYYLNAVLTPEVNTFRTSDYLSLTKFHRTELFNEFYRLFGGDTQMTSAMRISPTCLVTCSIHRPKKDFSDREVEMLKLFTPHLRAAFRNAQAVERIERERKYLAAVVERGIAVISADGDAVFINDIAKRLLNNYFGGFVADKLPDVLERYIEAEAAKLDGGDYYAPARPYRVKKEFSELIIRLAFDNAARELTLIFEEKAERSQGDFQCLGLTPRECEVLFWIGQGKTDGEIALICSISHRTVQKHAENIYIKLGVETRTAAVMAALKRLD